MILAEKIMQISEFYQKKKVYKPQKFKAVDPISSLNIKGVRPQSVYVLKAQEMLSQKSQSNNPEAALSSRLFWPRQHRNTSQLRILRRLLVLWKTIATQWNARVKTYRRRFMKIFQKFLLLWEAKEIRRMTAWNFVLWAMPSISRNSVSQCQYVRFRLICETTP